MGWLLPLLPETDVFAIALVNPRSSVPGTTVNLLLAGSFGRTSKMVLLLRIRSESTKSLLQLAAVDTVFVVDGINVDAVVKGADVRGPLVRLGAVVVAAAVVLAPALGFKVVPALTPAALL